jgi:transcription initiation factor TFIIIB Brf1 subunit/transcription initiation factor TFIIB
MCPECEETTMLTNNGEMKCQECNVVLERLTGFYDKHPEKKQQ